MLAAIEKKNELSSRNNFGHEKYIGKEILGG